MKSILALLATLLLLAPTQTAHADTAYKAPLPEGHNIQKGASVQYRGTTVGTVTDITLVDGKPIAHISVTDNCPRLTSTHTITPQATTLLGEKVLNISPGKTPGQPLATGTTLLAGTPKDTINLLDLIEKSPPTTQTLDPKNITGVLGTPLHTIQIIQCKVTDMSFTRLKADDGRLGIQILTVGGTPLAEKRYMHMPTFHDNRQPKPGDIYKLYVYETIETAGYPTEAFTKLDIPAHATQDLHFRPKLVILKEAQPE